MSSSEENAESQDTVIDLLKTPSDEYLEDNPTSVTKEQNIIVDHDEDEIGSEISKSITVILKAVTHRGTQTIIQCKPDDSKENFINMVINMKI